MAKLRGARKVRHGTHRHNRSDEVDGCDVDMTADPVSDEELLFVVFGEDEKKFEEYQRLLGTEKK